MRPIGPDLLNKIKSQEQTKANDADPRMSVVVSRARTTVMDSTYWTVETIRDKVGIGDISLAPRRLKSYGRPDRIYEIHVDNGVVKTTIREYPDRQKDGWQPQFELGAGSAVAMAFDGEWELWRGNWRLKTSEKPWIMWVDGAGKLQTQHWDDSGTRVELAENVVKVKAIRGWKNINFADRDHGIIACYIKTDGKLYYRNFCQQLDHTYQWENQREIVTTFNVANINMFILNDYRTGIAIEDTLGKIHWLITERNWAGMAIAPETISVAPAELEINFIPIELIEPKGLDETITVAPAELELALLYADTDNDFSAMNISKTIIGEEGEYEDWGWIIELNIDHPIPNFELSNITVTNLDNSTTIQITSISKVSDTVYKLNVSDIVESGINNVAGDLKVDIVGAINPAGYTYIDMSYTFTPVNLVPTVAPIPEVGEIWNE